MDTAAAVALMGRSRVGLFLNCGVIPLGFAGSGTASSDEACGRGGVRCGLSGVVSVADLPVVSIGEPTAKATCSTSSRAGGVGARPRTGGAFGLSGVENPGCGCDPFNRFGLLGGRGGTAGGGPRSVQSPERLPDPRRGGIGGGGPPESGDGALLSSNSFGTNEGDGGRDKGVGANIGLT